MFSGFFTIFCIVSVAPRRLRQFRQLYDHVSGLCTLSPCLILAHQLENRCKRTRDIVRKKYGTWPHCHSLSTDWHRHWSGWARKCAFTYRRMMPPFWPVTKKDPPIIKFRKLMTKILCATSLRKDRIPLLNT